LSDNAPGNCHSVCVITNSNAQINAIRPYVKLSIGGVSDNWLYDTGAAVSVISYSFWKNLKGHQGIKAKNIGSLSSANSSSIEVLDRRLLEITYKNTTKTISVYIARQLNERAIAGMDLINALGICYDPRSSSFISAIEETTTNVFTSSEVYLRPFQAIPIRVRLADWDTADTTAILQLHAPEWPALFANPGVYTVFDKDKSTLMLKNCDGTEVKLPRGYPIGTATPVSDVALVSMDKMLDIQSSKPPPLKTDSRAFLKQLNLNVPDSERAAYQQLLLQNHDIFSKNADDLGAATHFEHSIQLKNFDPVFRKQFRIPDEHAAALQEQVKEWLKMGIIEPCHSRYNSPIFAVPKKGVKSDSC